MSSLITIQVKTNICLGLFKNSLMLALLLCHCSHFTDTTIIMTITACPTQLFAILLTTATVLFRHNFTQGCINSYWLVARFVLLYYVSAQRSQSKRFAIWPSLDRPLVVPFCLMLVIVGLFGTCAMCLLVCKAYTLTLVAFAFSISFTLIIFVFVAFANCFRVKWY